MNAFLSTSPYQDYVPYLNVFTIAVASPESGSDHPPLKQFANTYFNGSYDSGGPARS